MTHFFQFLYRNPVVCFTVITIVHWQNGHVWSTASKVNTVCNTAECKKLDDMYKKNRNSFGRACTDFYDYACHGWGQQFPKPDSAQTWGTTQMIQESVFLELKKMLEDETEHNQKVLETTKALYKACMTAPYLEKSEPGILRDIIKRTAVWPIMHPNNTHPPLNVHSWAVNHLYIKIAGESALFDFRFLVDERDKKTITLEVTHLKSPYGMLKLHADWKQPQLSKYKLFLKTIIGRVAPLGQKLSDKIVDNDLRIMMQFREELAKIIENIKSQPTIPVEVRDLQNWYDNEVKPSVNAEINWLLVLRAIYKTPKDPDGLKVTQNTVVYVQKTYFLLLAKLLARTDRRTIVNHIHLYFLERHIKIDSSLRILLKDSVTVGMHPSGVIRYEKERFRNCIERSNVKLPLSQLYLQTTLTDAKKADVIAIIDVAKGVLKDEIRESNWVDDGTRKHLNDKINKLRKTIGYTERVDVPLDSIMAFACFFAQKNQIYVTAAFLNPPMYTPNVPYEIQYGSTMSILSHELYHAFDYNGMMHGGGGELAPLSVKMNQEYSDRIECFTDFYEKFKDKAFKKYDYCLHRIFSAETLDEDFADAMGLKLAYKAYRMKLKQNNGTCSVLPSFTDLSCDQMFFVAYANTMCEASSINVQENDLFCDAHNGPQVRINAAVANMKEFSDAFGCKTDDILNVQKRCDIWK